MESPPLLVTNASDDWIASHVVPRTGPDLYAVEVLKTEVLGVGASEVILRSDQEPAIIALKNDAAALVKLAGGNVQTEDTPKYDSRSNGLAESAVKAVKDKVRTMLAVVNASYGIKITGDHVLIPSLVKYCGAMLSRGFRGADGRTAYERRKG